jgi:SAM-dependent methyltransferase
MPSSPASATPNPCEDRQAHWQGIYAEKAPDQVSWYRPHLDSSLALIERIAPDRATSIIDAGGGASTLVDDLLFRGYRNLTVLDVASEALLAAQRRLGEAAGQIHWLAGDLLTADLPAAAFDLWHDRAVFHFLTAPEDRAGYVRRLARALRPGGHVLVSTFGPEGPTRCSGLEVVRYDASALMAELGPRFRPVQSFTELHRTPSGATQQFVFCHAVLEL